MKYYYLVLYSRVLTSKNRNVNSKIIPFSVNKCPSLWVNIKIFTILLTGNKFFFFGNVPRNAYLDIHRLSPIILGTIVKTNIFSVRYLILCIIISVSVPCYVVYNSSLEPCIDMTITIIPILSWFLLNTGQSIIYT